MFGSLGPSLSCFRVGSAVMAGAQVWLGNIPPEAGESGAMGMLSAYQIYPQKIVLRQRSPGLDRPRARGRASVFVFVCVGV